MAELSVGRERSRLYRLVFQSVIIQLESYFFLDGTTAKRKNNCVVCNLVVFLINLNVSMQTSWKQVTAFIEAWLPFTLLDLYVDYIHFSQTKIYT